MNPAEKKETLGDAELPLATSTDKSKPARHVLVNSPRLDWLSGLIKMHRVTCRPHEEMHYENTYKTKDFIYLPPSFRT
jgi:hypothetical protein